MMKVLVTGASGFVGSALCRSLAAGPFQVVGQVRSLCNPVTGVEYVRAELKESTKLDAALRGVECVVHLAGLTCPPISVPRQT
ncbi:NAD-dependent epimerase/dehydratase family protein [Pseudomonas aeruginosa]|nr:NAD-dependent epimerase/dehydratase family protein [Pseudomonas aeruginosa]